MKKLRHSDFLRSEKIAGEAANLLAKIADLEAKLALLKDHRRKVGESKNIGHIAAASLEGHQPRK